MARDSHKIMNALYLQNICTQYYSSGFLVVLKSALQGRRVCLNILFIRIITFLFRGDTEVIYSFTVFCSVLHSWENIFIQNFILI